MEIWCHNQLQRCPENITSPNVTSSLEKNRGGKVRNIDTIQSSEDQLCTNSTQATTFSKCHCSVILPFTCQNVTYKNSRGSLPLNKSNTSKKDKRQEKRMIYSTKYRPSTKTLPSNLPSRISLYPHHTNVKLIPFLIEICTHLMGWLLGEKQQKSKKWKMSHCWPMTYSLIHLVFYTILSLIILDSSQGSILGQYLLNKLKL